MVWAIHQVPLPLSFRQTENAYTPCVELIFWLSEEYSSQPCPCSHHRSRRSPRFCQPEWLPWPLTLPSKRSHLWKHHGSSALLPCSKPSNPHSTQWQSTVILSPSYTNLWLWLSVTHMHFISKSHFMKKMSKLLFKHSHKAFVNIFSTKN